jgi:uncharacterized protein YcfL
MNRWVIVLVLITFLFNGCSNKEAFPGEKAAKITDNCIVDDIKVIDIKGKKQSDGFMKTQITGENNSDNYMQLEYKIVWLDEDGFVIDSIFSNWKTVSAEPKQNFYITNVSPNDNADDFKLYIRQNDQEIKCN